MRVDVIMPQMGESIAEGTITRWFKKVGETVDRDEPLFEISTDKVDAEIPSPDSGTLVEIKNQEGETVPVNEVVAVIETEAGQAAEAPAPAVDEKAAEAPPAEAVAAPPAAPPEPGPAPAAAAAPSGGGKFVSPVVRRIADEHGIDPAAVPGTGAGGRVTKKDILSFVEQGGATTEAPRSSRRGHASSVSP
jgi:2-oxoglutarate dehydrogenase E2 component (dihydrolipoamide succinyltransferase)